MSVYIIAEFEIQDREQYNKYEAEFMPIFEKYEGTLLSVDEGPVVMEGEWSSTRSVLISFPTEDDAYAWYHSEEYQRIAQYRKLGSKGKSILVKGI